MVVHTLDTLKLLGEQRYDCQWVPTGRSSLPLLTLPDSGILLLFADTRLCVVDVPLPAPPVSAGQYVGFSRDMVYVARDDRLFVSRPLDNELAVLDRASLKVRRRLPMLGSPTGLAMSDDGQRVFVALAHGAGLAIVDSTKLTWRMHRYAMPSDVSGLQALVNLGRDRLLALTSGEKLHLALIDASAEPILSFTPFRADATATGVRFDRVHGLLYVSGRTTPDNREILYRIDVNTPTAPQLVASTHSASDGTPLLGLQSMALNPAGTTLVSGNGVAIAPLSFARKYLLRLDGADMTTSHHGAGLLFSADGKTIEYGRSNGFVQRFNAVSGKPLQSRALPCGQNGMDISQMVAAPGVDDLLVRGNDMICSKDKSTPYYPPNDQPITPTPIADKVGDLFPLHANAKWVFQRGKQRWVQRVTGSRMASTRQPIWSLQTADGNREEYRLNADLRGIGARLPKGISVKFARPVTVLAHGDVLDFPYESQTVAYFANAKGETANVDYGFTRTALGYEQVKVPAGSFRALHVRQEEILSPFGEPERRSKADIWLAPGVGPVKIITSNKQSVLVSYAVDSDGDGITARRDNCTIVANANQLDTDADQQGDACDLDDDNDQISDLLDNCQRRVNLDQRDTDFDAIGDACDWN